MHSSRQISKIVSSFISNLLGSQLSSALRPPPIFSQRIHHARRNPFLQESPTENRPPFPLPSTQGEVRVIVLGDPPPLLLQRQMRRQSLF
ncbi:hypothetical protein ERO13_A13G062450v2 [Gossypium hirsutum]|nr:hypothetical protein ERO13_A13G062450v2 [Gossypium hirsutum]